jgi:ABC-type transport system involved in cytochrome bd biosynthesis fused ATPase/permease subunit
MKRAYIKSLVSFIIFIILGISFIILQLYELIIMKHLSAIMPIFGFLLIMFVWRKYIKQIYDDIEKKKKAWQDNLKQEIIEELR